MEISEFEFISTIENFYDDKGGLKEGAVHEICFVYKTGKIEGVDPKYGLVEFKKEEMKATYTSVAIFTRKI